MVTARPLFLTLLILLLLVGPVGCPFSDDPTWERIQETQVLRVGMDASFPPFEAVAADGSLVGFDVDLAREISRRLGVEPAFVANLPYDGLYDALTAQRVDIVISALVVNPSRTADFAYSSVYFDAGEVLVVPQQDGSVQSVADLEDHSLAVVLGTPGDRQAREWSRRSEHLSVVQYSTPTEALDALHRGEIDAALVDRVSVLQAIGEGMTLIIVGEPIIPVPYAIAMRRDSQRLLREINRALAAMNDDGSYDRLVAEWLKGGG